MGKRVQLPVGIITENDLQRNAWDNRLDRVWAIVDKAWVLNPGAHVPTFATFDSQYFGLVWKESNCVFVTNTGKQYPMLGREANYYFEGLLFAAFKQSMDMLVQFIFAWKASYIAQNPLRKGVGYIDKLETTNIRKWGTVKAEGDDSAIQVPSPNDIFMAYLGYLDHDWYLARRGASDRQKMAKITRFKSFDTIWQEAQELRDSTLPKMTQQILEKLKGQFFF